MSENRSLEIARKLVGLGKDKEAAKAYKTALNEGIEDNPGAELEAALWNLQFGDDYQVSYTVLHRLHCKGLFREEAFSIMTEAFYTPNVKDLKSHYERNCKLLKKYPYFFRDNFVPFEELPILFYPYSDNSYIPYYIAEDRFGDLIDFKEPVIRHHFFHDLENPILAKDIFSQYELEYLNDNVRDSTYVAKENHIYLHYTNWAVFCAYLQCINIRMLLEDKKFVFLIEDGVAEYPIDFKERFGIDYSKFTLRPIGIREVSRLIWHTQLSTHNGGDFFNEIFDNHPNLIVMPSLMLSNVEEVMTKIRQMLDLVKSTQDTDGFVADWDPRYVRELYLMKGRTERDFLVAYFLNDKRATAGLDYSSRIAPALFFQPHFPNIVYMAELDMKGRAALVSGQYDRIMKSPIFRNFKYIKTFTPMRRLTNSHAATVRFMLNSAKASWENPQPDGKRCVVADAVTERIMNRSFMLDPHERLYRDSVLVRFEDGKLNPTATFTALAAFLDLPYTESMTYCSEYGRKLEEGRVGMSIESVYRTYDEYANDAERYLIEYFMRDAYEYYGYDCNYYHGEEVDVERVKELIAGCTTIDGYIRQTYHPVLMEQIKDGKTLIPGKKPEESVEITLDNAQERMDKERMRTFEVLMNGLNFVNRAGQPLYMMPKLKLDAQLLERPIYH
ncbi:hypothetical protein [Acutalibacter sp. 1XD8-36]|uniref:hypothetical protein n=1 Tax=Acutalibacter sp. 1XD8-36 TaxID=2320852 RepID=UPI0014130A75|nr:hypothetical protein [Acutalibacter sp. 1XD8-36]NBJ90910.1 hypothetical protein [Acutalibacter sp. 1XD8-36]